MPALFSRDSKCCLNEDPASTVCAGHMHARTTECFNGDPTLFSRTHASISTSRCMRMSWGVLDPEAGVMWKLPGRSSPA